MYYNQGSSYVNYLTKIYIYVTIILRKGDFYVKQPNKKIYKEEQEINSIYWLF